MAGTARSHVAALVGTRPVFRNAADWGWVQRRRLHGGLETASPDSNHQARVGRGGRGKLVRSPLDGAPVIQPRGSQMVISSGSVEVGRAHSKSPAPSGYWLHRRLHRWAILHVNHHVQAPGRSATTA